MAKECFPSLSLIFILVCALTRPSTQQLLWSQDAYEGKNPECDKEQLLINSVVRPKNTMEIQAAVRQANALDLPLCVKSGGHSYTCNYAKPNCFQIDLSEMKSVVMTTTKPETTGDLLHTSTTPDRYFLTFETGALARDLLAVAPESDFTFVHGECFSVGAGYYLHGGIHLGYGTALYGVGAQNVRELEIVLANATTITVSDATLIRHLTRAGSSFGIVSKIKLEIYKRPSPKSWFLTILSSSWTVDEAEMVYMKLRELKRLEPSFHANLYIGFFGGPPALQVAYLGEDVSSDDESLDRCMEFIATRLGLTMPMRAREEALFYDFGLSLLHGSGFGAGYHLVLPTSLTDWRLGWEARPYATSNFALDEGDSVTPSLDLVRPYFEQAWRTENIEETNSSTGYCMLILGSQFISGLPKEYSPTGYITFLDYTCFGESLTLATDLTKRLADTKTERGTYWRYYNTPVRDDDKCRYWPDYDELMEVKQQLDPTNRFDVFQGIHFNNMSIHNDGDCTGFSL